jgi:RNA recognition motif-containing protein
LEPAAKAIAAIDGKALEDGSTMMVTKFEKKQNRWQALKKSLARSNLYVRNFDKNVTEEDLKKFFGGDQVVRNVRIMTTEVNKDGEVVKESKQFGFVSFASPKDAADIIGRYNNEDLEFNNKQLYVNYYEDKSARKKRLANKKERNDNILGLLDPSALGGAADGNNSMMEYFMQVFQTYFKNYASNPNAQFNTGGYPNYNQHSYNQDGRYNNNYRGSRGSSGRQHRNYPSHSNSGYYSHNQAHQMYNRPPPRQDASHSYASAGQSVLPPISNLPPSVGAPQVIGLGTLPPVQAQQPPINSPSVVYNSIIKTMYNSHEFKAMEEETKREKIGEEIYNYVLDKAGEENAPKITGMIIDLPFNDLITSVQSYEGLQEKIQEGLDLLKDDQ